MAVKIHLLVHIILCQKMQLLFLFIMCTNFGGGRETEGKKTFSSRVFIHFLVNFGQIIHLEIAIY